MEEKKQEFNLDIIALIAQIQASFLKNYGKLKNNNSWEISDARLQVFLNCSDIASNAALSIGLLDFASSNGFETKEWWQRWSIYSSNDLNELKDFKRSVDNYRNRYKQKVQEQLVINSQIFTESFLRNIARQFNITDTIFYKLKTKLLMEKLKLKEEEMTPFTVFQYLKNSMHNKGIHYDNRNPKMKFEINGCEFNFNQNETIKISWNHFKELLIANSDLLYKIIETPIIMELPDLLEQNLEVFH